MWYMGGKQRQSKALLQVLGPYVNDCSIYVEPFMGAMGSAEKLVPAAGINKLSIMLSDFSSPLVCLWNSVLQGWVPPDFVTEGQYKLYADKRHCPDSSDPMTAWRGYGLSFGGKWFGGYARGGAKGQSSEKMQINQKKALIRKKNAISPYVSRVECLDYTEVNIPRGALVYLDPPYANRTVAHHASGGFDDIRFWEYATKLSDYAEVFVTEFNAPQNWERVFSWGDTVVRHNKSRGRQNISESIYRLK